MRKFRTYHEVDPSTGSELLEQVVEQRRRLATRLAAVGAVVAVASGKGGVGKSAVTANLAAALARRGRRVGALDGDLNGPSLARMLGVVGKRLEEGEEGVVPPASEGGVRVVSMELLQATPDAPLRWRDPGSDTFLWQSSMETSALREFLTDVSWDGCDYLLVDVPPGTDKIRRLLELVPDLDAALVVTTPAEMARAVVARSIRLIRESGVERMGIVANMTEYLCPDCGSRHRLFGGDGVRRLADETGLEIWADVPFHPALGRETDAGRPPTSRSPESPAGAGFAKLADRLEAEVPPDPAAARPSEQADT